MNAYALTRQPWRTPHSLGRGSRMAIESKLYSLGNSCARRGDHNQLSQFSFAAANLGQSLWPSKELTSLRRMDTKLRAERVRRRPPLEDSDNWRRTNGEDYVVEEGPSIWDSNAENIRRPKSKRTYYSEPDVDEAPSPSRRERSNESENNRWDYEVEDRSGNNRWGGYGRSNESGNSEWDYVAELPRGKTKPVWERWFAGNGDDNDEVEEEEEEDEEEDNWLSGLNVDLSDIWMLVRWGVPAAFLLFTAVIPVMVGNPLMLLLGFSIFPTVVKWLNPLVKDVFSSAANPFGSSSTTRTKRRSQAASTYSRRGQDTEKYTDFGSLSQPTRSSDSNVSRREVPSQKSSLGGWDDLVEDRSRFEAASRWPLQRRTKSGKKLARREQPLAIRIILAFFPFLRGWAGLL